MSSAFEKMVCDVQCVLASCADSYPRDGRRTMRILVFARPEDSSQARFWITWPHHPRLAYRLLVEIEERGFHVFHLETPRKRPLRTIVVDMLCSYKQRRVGKALLQHRAAQAIVLEAGLGDRYSLASQQLQALAVGSKNVWGEIRRAERFAKYVRLAAYHALMARDLETLQ